MKFLPLLLVLCLSVPVYAQESLTASERLKLENAVLQQHIEVLTREVAQWRQLFAQASARLGEFEVAVAQEQTQRKRDAVVKEIEAARPGFVFDPFTGAFTSKEKKE